jgi:hypothetical protein
MICKPRAPTRGRTRASPRLEWLQDRQLLSVSFCQVGDVLTILGDARPNKIFVADDGTAGNYNITEKGDKTVFTSSAHVSTIKIQNLAGADTIMYVVGDLSLPKECQ